MTVIIPSVGPWWPGRLLLSERQGGGYAPAGDLGDVLVDGRAADAEQPGDGGDGVVRPGEQVAGVADLLGCHGRGAAEAGAAGAGGVQSLAGALDDQLADELGQRGEDVEDQSAAAVVVSRASCRLLKPTPCLRGVPTIPIRSAKDRDSRSRLGTTRVSPGRR